MNSRIKTIATTLLVALLSSTSLLAETKLMIDTDKSGLNWKGSKVTGSHTGTLKIKEGFVEIVDGKPSGGTVIFDMNSINNTDIDDPEYKTKLENHLESNDFFNVKEFSTAKFEITDIKPIADSNKHQVSGNLTIRGISNPFTFESEIKENEESYTAQADVKFDRTKWNVNYNSGKIFDLARLGDKLIYDEIEVSFNLIAPKG